MAKTKHEVLATAISQMLTDIDQFTEKGRRCLQLVQFGFYTKVLPLNVPPPPTNVLEGLVKPHAVGLSILAPSQELRQACSSFGASGVILPQRILLKSQCPCIPPNTNFATWWGVKITLPKEMEPLIENGRWDTLLYCPDTTEMSDDINWFEKDDHTNSLSYTMQIAFETMEKENAGKAIIRRNLDQLALPHFRLIVKKWQNDPDGHDTIPKNPATIFKRPFAPTEHDYIAHAYEKVRRALRERSFRNYEHLMILWRNFLENLMFTGVTWDDNEKASFAKQWELNIFGCPIKRSKRNEGRWEQSMTIDRPTAGKLLQHFIDRFLASPLKNKKDGEIACVLWTLIWLSQDPQVRDITLTRILALDTTVVDREHAKLRFDGKSVKISIGLHRLLIALRGNGTAKRRRLLFKHLSADYLQHALQESSILLFGPDALPISPSSFLSLPHPMTGSRLSRNQVESFRSSDPGLEVGYYRRQFLKAFQEAQSKTFLSSL